MPPSGRRGASSTRYEVRPGFSLNDPQIGGRRTGDLIRDRRTDLRAIAQRYDVANAFKNGPRLWCLGDTYVRVGRPFGNDRP